MRQGEKTAGDSVEDQSGSTYTGTMHSTGMRNLWQSPRVEKILLPYTLRSTEAHVRMLGDSQLIEPEVAERVAAAIIELAAKNRAGEVFITAEDEDVTSAIQRHLAETLGEDARVVKQFFTPRDQFSTDIRLWMKETVVGISFNLLRLRDLFVALAERDRETIMPSYVHQKKSRSISLADFWLANEMRFARDFNRLEELRERLETLPLSEAVQLSSGKFIERSRIGLYLGFETVIENTLDAASDRDHLLEFAAFASLLGVHISQMASDLMTWSMHEFGFIRLPRPFFFKDQEISNKKHQELLGIMRSRPAAIFGRMQEILSAMKGLSINYSQDIEECLPGVMETADHITFLVEMSLALLPQLEFDVDSLRDAANPVVVSGESAIDYLVNRDVRRPAAEKIVEQVMQYCKDRRKQPIDMTMNEWNLFSQAFDEGVYDAVANTELEQPVVYNNEWLSPDVSQRIVLNVERARKDIERDRAALPVFPD